MPLNHFSEVKRWFGFVEMQRKVRPWVEPGETYSMTMWAPKITEETVLGDFKVRTREVEIGSDEAQVVLANPLIYRTDEDDPDIHENLRGNRPYYFDGPERHVDHEVIFGFGDHGIESRVIGNTSDETGGGRAGIHATGGCAAARGGERGCIARRPAYGIMQLLGRKCRPGTVR